MRTHPHTTTDVEKSRPPHRFAHARTMGNAAASVSCCRRGEIRSERALSVYNIAPPPPSSSSSSSSSPSSSSFTSKCCFASGRAEKTPARALFEESYVRPSDADLSRAKVIMDRMGKDEWDGPLSFTDENGRTALYYGTSLYNFFPAVSPRLSPR